MTPNDTAPTARDSLNALHDEALTVYLSSLDGLIEAKRGELAAFEKHIAACRTHCEIIQSLRVLDKLPDLIVKLVGGVWSAASDEKAEGR